MREGVLIANESTKEEPEMIKINRDVVTNQAARNKGLMRLPKGK
jgi:hypothetical protein